jgi:hypothetical protein
MYMTLAAAGNLGGFTAGAAYVTQGANIYVVPPGGGSSTLLTISGTPLAATQGHSGIQFDTQGAFGYNLIFTSSEGVWTVTSAGVATKIALGVSPGNPVYIESPSVAPTGVLYVTVEDDTFPAGVGPLSGLYSLGGGVLTVVAGGGTGGNPGTQSPESINFVPTPTCSLSIKGVPYGGFLSVFSQGTVGLLQPPTSSIDGFLFSAINANAGKAIETFEYASTSGYATGPDMKVYDPVAGTFATFADVPNQLEGFNLVTCHVPPPPPPPTGCPATQGFWHKGANWPAVNASFGGIVYNGGTDFSMVIGGKTYTQTELLQVMPSGGLHSGNYANSLSQLIAAVLNIAAGAQHTIGAFNAIASDNGWLNGVQIFCGASLNTLCSVPATVVSGVEANLTALDNYNSALGLRCSEGAGLTIGSGKGPK